MSNMQFFQRIAERLPPVQTTFVASLLLSLVAWSGSTVNRDGMLYVKAAQAFLTGGFAAAREVFNWPFLSVAMGIVSKVSGLSPETSGYLLNAFFMAGACALMVDCIERRQRQLAWMACLTVLALPGLNEYRNELLREFGGWFFVMFSFWLALRWSERPRWLGALAIQTTLACAALFRPEALALFPALIAWQCYAAPRDERLRRLAMLGAFPFVCAIILIKTLVSGMHDEDSRLIQILSRINTAHFDVKAQALATTLIEYAREQARTILFFGSLALVPIKVLQKFGVFLLPLAFFLCSSEMRQTTRRYSLFAWGIATHVVVLGIFVLSLQFLAGRYAGLILLFATPFVSAGLLTLIQRFPRGRIVAISLTLTLAVANVVSTGPGKTHFVDAGRWLAGSTVETNRVYIDSGRTAYYADWQTAAVATRNDRTSVEHALASGNYDLFVLEISRKDPPVDDWLQQTGLRVIKRFDHPNRDAVIVATPVAKERP